MSHISALLVNPSSPSSTEVVTYGPIRQPIRVRPDTLVSAAPYGQVDAMRNRCCEYKRKFVNLLEYEARLKKLQDDFCRQLWWIDLMLCEDPSDQFGLIKEMTNEKSRLNQFLLSNSPSSKQLCPHDRVALIIFEKELSTEQRKNRDELQKHIWRLSDQLVALHSSEYGLIREDLVQLLDNMEKLEAESAPSGCHSDWERLSKSMRVYMGMVSRLEFDDKIVAASRKMLLSYQIVELVDSDEWRLKNVRSLDRWRRVKKLICGIKEAINLGQFELEIDRDPAVIKLLRALCIDRSPKKREMDLLLKDWPHLITDQLYKGWEEDVHSLCSS